MTAILGKRIDGDQLALLCFRAGLHAADVSAAYDHGPEIIVIGIPRGEHDCEAMGCGQEHVVRRIANG